ncbi:MAG: DUF2461 domain-containing protein [Bacteroidota bacterium]|nr:DUF2461 domain-containing protein [Bacteroidota bacterium]
MKKINKNYIDFFIELSQNNHKEWFDKNRSRYESEVKIPFTDLVNSLISELKEQEKLLDITAKDCVFRINKDVRFSKDKQPYKLQMGASICRNGKKDMENPGLYFEIGPEFLKIYTGVYMPDKNSLERIRIYISKNIEIFNKIISENQFLSNFEAVKGEKNKILPKHLKELSFNHPILFNKQFYIIHQIETENIIKLDIKQYILDIYKTAYEFNSFLRKAL